MANKIESGEVLRFFGKEDVPAQGTIKKYYAVWRQENNIPKRCDIPECHFHTHPLVWCGKPVVLILDHIDGCHLNNHPDNLRYLCPACNSQQPTTGGGNKGRIKDMGESGYSVQERGSDDKQCKLFDYLSLTEEVEVKIETKESDES